MVASRLPNLTETGAVGADATFLAALAIRRSPFRFLFLTTL
jgi:hypothetical protein